MRPVLPLLLALATACAGQDVAAIASQARRDPEGALRELERQLAGPPGKATRELQLLRPRLLLQAARREEAREAWRALAARGEPVEGELLALEDASLELAPAELVAPGAPLRLVLRGARTGPVALRLYRVDAPRLRAAIVADPARSVRAHLRSPPPAALARVAAWELPGLGGVDGPDGAASVTPVALEPGVWLVTATARGVSVPLVALASPAVAVILRGTGPGALVLADGPSGRPLPGVPLEALDAQGASLGALGATDAAGLLRFGGAPASAFGWVGDVPVAFSLPAEEPPPAPRAPAVALDLPVHRPGDPIRARLVGLRPGAEPARLLDPRGQPFAAAPLVVDRSGQALVDLPFPPEAAPGAWSLVVGGLRLPVPVAAPHPPAALELSAAAATTSRQLQLRARARLASGAPLGGRALRWRVLAAPGDALAPRDQGPLSPFALRPAPGAALEVVARGSARLDARGELTLDAPIPAYDRPTLLRVDAALDLGGGHLLAARTHAAAGPQELRLALGVDRPVLPPGEQVVATAWAARLDGTPAELQDLLLELPDGTERALRTGPDGAARTSLTFAAPGPVTLGLRPAGAALPRATAGLLVASRSRVTADAPPPADPTGVRLVLEEPPAQDAPARLLAVLPWERGWALVATKGPDGALAARVAPVERGVVRLEAPPGEAALVAAVVAGRSAVARLDVAPYAPPLAVAIERVASAPDELLLDVRVTSEGRGRAAALVGDLFDEATARLLARDEASGELDPGWGCPPLGSPARALDDSNGAGRGRLRLRAPGRRAWVRVTARDGRGGEGVGWCRVGDVEPAAAGLDVRLEGPTHAVDGDALEVVVVARCPAGPGALRLSWRVEGGLRAGVPRAVGARPLLLGDPGPAALRVEAGPDLRVALPLEVDPVGPPGPRPRTARLVVTAGLEGGAAPVEVSRPFVVWGRALPWSWSLSGVVADRATTEGVLSLPEGATPGAAVLTVAVTPDAAAAALAALGALRDEADPLVVPLVRLAGQRRAAAVVAARRLRPALLPPPVTPEAVRSALATLLAARGADGRWGRRTAAVARALEGLRGADPALDAALAAGLLPPAEAPPDPTGLTPDERARRALALHLSGAGEAEVQAAIASAVDAEDAGPARLERVDARADLARVLLARGLRPALARELVDGVLFGRAGPGWDDADDAASGLALLLDVAATSSDVAVEVTAALEGKELLRAWSGDGLSKWTGPAALAGPQVTRKARFAVSARDGPASWSFRVDAAAPRPAGALPRRLLRLGPDGAPPAPVGEAGVRAGDVLRLEVDPGPAAAVELPLPAGARLLAAPPGSRLADGVLVLPAGDGPVAVDLLLDVVGVLRLRPARAGALTSDEAILRVRE